MKRTLSLLLALLMLVVPFAGCSGGGTPSQSAAQSPAAQSQAPASTPASQAAPAPADKAIEMEMWTGPDWKGVYDPNEPNADYTDFLNFVSEEYKKEHPNVTITPVLIDGTQRAEKISIAAQSNALPVLYYEATFAMGDYIHEGLMEPIDEIITAEDRADIPQALFDSSSIGGNVYFFPFSVELGMMAVNVSLFEEAGVADLIPEGDVIQWTPDQFRAALEGIKDKLPNVYPFGFWCGNQNGDTWNNMYLRMFGGKFTADDGSSLTINSPEGVQALTFLQGLAQDGLIAPGAETMGNGDVFNMFKNKNLAVSGLNNITYAQLAADLESGAISQPFDFKWAYFPTEGNPYCFTYVKGGGVFKNDDPDKIAAAKDFIHFFSQAPYTDASLILMPARSSLQKAYAEKDANLALAASTLGNSIPVNNGMPGYITTRGILFPMLQGIVTGQVQPEQGLADYVNAANAEVAKAVERSLILNP